jgi:hypothetical protein
MVPLIRRTELLDWCYLYCLMFIFDHLSQFPNLRATPELLNKESYQITNLINHNGYFKKKGRYNQYKILKNARRF